MDVDCLPYKQTGYFSRLICDYLDRQNEVEGFYGRYPSLENFKVQIEEKQRNFPEAHRAVLYDSLKEQYGHIKASKKTRDNLIGLKEPITFYGGHRASS